MLLKLKAIKRRQLTNLLNNGELKIKKNFDFVSDEGITKGKEILEIFPELGQYKEVKERNLEVNFIFYCFSIIF